MWFRNFQTYGVGVIEYWVSLWWEIQQKPNIKSLGKFDFTQTCFSDDDFIGAGLGGMGYSRRLYKRQFQTANLLEVDFKPEFLKNRQFTSCNILKCPYGS